MANNQKHKILLLGVSAGAGHMRAAQAVAAAAAGQPDFECECLDVLDFVPATFRKAYADSYLQLIERAALVWAHLYARTDKRRADSKWDRLRRGFEKANTRRIMLEVEKRAPDSIVCTHFLPAELLSRRIRRGRATSPVFVQVTDFDVHGLWVHPHISGYCVATAEIAARLRRLRHDSSRAGSTRAPCM